MGPTEAYRPDRRLANRFRRLRQPSVIHSKSPPILVAECDPVTSCQGAADGARDLTTSTRAALTAGSHPPQSSGHWNLERKIAHHSPNTALFVSWARIFQKTPGTSEPGIPRMSVKLTRL